MKSKFTFSFLFTAIILGFQTKSHSQCTWHQVLFDSFEYTTPCPDIIPGTTYGVVPQTYSAHSGTRSLYMNFVDCVGSTGTCPGDTVYVRNIPVCPGIPIRFSTWFTTTFSGVQCDLEIRIIDTLNIVLASTSNLIPPYSTAWTQYQSPTIYPLTSSLSFVIITNEGGSNGNDLGMDDFYVERCYDLPLGPDSVVCKNQTVPISTDSIFASYLWNDGSTNQTLVATYGGPGTDTSNYFVAVTDVNGCEFYSDTVTIIFTDCGGINFGSSDTSFCEKQCIDFFDLSGNSPTSWQWSFPGANPDTSTAQNPTSICYNNYGSFDVTLITCNGIDCDTLTQTAFIHEYQNPVDSIYFSNDTLWSLPFPSYQWYLVSVGPIAGATNQYFIAANPGSYYCVVDDSIGCIATSNTLVATGIKSAIGNLQFAIFPNPNDGSFEIVISELSNSPFGDKKDLAIYDATGRIVFKTQHLTHNTKLHLNLENGIYFLEFGNDSNMIRQKMIISK